MPCNKVIHHIHAVYCCVLNSIGWKLQLDIIAFSLCENMQPEGHPFPAILPHMENFPYTRIIVVGTTSAGKSTFAEKLANILDLDFVELDALYWQPNWVGTPDDEFILKVADATSRERWVVAGTYSRTIPTTWRRAEVVIWLDYSLSLVSGN